MYETDDEKFEAFGRCPDCNDYGQYWCKSCNDARFRQAFSTWTSGNKEIDYFIQNSQIHAMTSITVLEWWPYETFSNVEKIGKGGYGTVFRANTGIQRIKGWDKQNNRWLRYEKSDSPELPLYREFVALKTLGYPQHLPKNFLDEVIRQWCVAILILLAILLGVFKDNKCRRILIIVSI